MFTTTGSAIGPRGLGGAAPTAGAPTSTPFSSSTFGKGLEGFLSGGAGGSIADILSSLFGGRQIAGGFGDLQSQIQGGIGQQKQSLAQALGLLQPFQAGGAQAFKQELAGLGGDPTANINKILSQFQQSPAQKATIQSGLESVQNRMGAQGLGQSGAEQKALEQFAQQQTGGQQQQFLQNVLGEQSQQLGGLQGLAGLGLGAARTGAGGAMQAGTNIADLLESLGLTQSAQAQAGAQGTSDMLGGLGGLLGSIGTIASLF